MVGSLASRCCTLLCFGKSREACWEEEASAFSTIRSPAFPPNGEFSTRYASLGNMPASTFIRSPFPVITPIMQLSFMRIGGTHSARGRRDCLRAGSLDLGPVDPASRMGPGWNDLSGRLGSYGEPACADRDDHG